MLQNIPPLKVAYISAVTPSSCTVSGPPATLDAFFSNKDSTKPAIQLPIGAPFHATHVPFDTTSFLRHIGNNETLHLGVRRPLLSPHTGQPYEATTFLELVPLVLQDIFVHSINESLVFAACKHQISEDVAVNMSSIVASGLHRRLDNYLSLATTSSRPRSPSPTQQQSSTNSRTTSSVKGNEIAIVGMSGRFPGASSLAAFWDVLAAGTDLSREIPHDRFDATSKPGLSRFGCFLDQPGLFDARLFNMSPREAASTDPGQRLLLLSTYEALEMAGYTQEEERDRKVGTFFGQTIDDWREYNAGGDNVDMYYVTGGIRAFSAGHVNYHFKWDGPAYSVDSACSSSLLAIQLACKSLVAGECNMAVAGGSNILTGCNMYAGLSKGSFLSQTGSCKTFDAGADGYCRGEGVGVVVLKRLSEAISSGDRLLAVIKAAATNHSAEAVSITHPHVETQERLYRDVMAQAGALQPAEIDYVECHGTGTQAGDGAESNSVVNVLCKTSSGGKVLRERPLIVGSIKPNIGHGEAAAGVSSLIKAVMMMQRDEMLPHVGVKGELNPKLPSFAEGWGIASSGPFEKHANGRPRRVMVNNFSAAGGNTSILLEDFVAAGDDHSVVSDQRSMHVVTVSAKSLTSFRGNLERLHNYLTSETPLAELPNIAYTSTARRMHHHGFRKAYCVNSTGQLATLVGKDHMDFESELTRTTAHKSGSPAVIFSFPGQGVGIVGIANELYKTSPSFQHIICELDSLCVSQNLPSIVQVLLGNLSEDPSPVQTQLSLCLLEIALAQLWQSWGIQPTLVIGHSLGEYAALCIAGVLSPADVIFLVAKRASLMMETCTPGTHKMLSLRLSENEAAKAIEEAGLPSVEITCVNGPKATVVAGQVEEIERLMERQKAVGVSATLLDVPYSFHSAQMDPLLDEYLEAAGRVVYKKPKIPVSSSRLGCVIRDEGVFNASYLVGHAREPVQFASAVLEGCEDPAVCCKDNAVWVEMGPGTTCSSLARQSASSATSTTHTFAASMDTKKATTWDSISTTLSTLYTAGVGIRWTEFHRDYKQALHAVDLPTYAFDLKNHWLTYNSSTQPAPIAEPVMPRFSSPCFQEIREESFNSEEASVKFATDLHRSELAAMVHGHSVGGISLCPSSIYASMAFSCALYLFQKRDPSLVDVPPMDISDMEIFSPCVVAQPGDMGEGTQHDLVITATQSSPSAPVELTFCSGIQEPRMPSSQVEYRQHARCVVHLTDQKMGGFTEAERNLYLIQDRVDALHTKEANGDVHRLRKKMVYKLFNAVVDYAPEYHGMDNVYLAADRPETCINLSFESPLRAEDFVHNPFWIDNLAQIGGFSLNVNPPSGKDDVYISHGWESMRILHRLSAEEQYTGYVRMQPSSAEPGLYSGDVYVFSGKKVVALCMGLKFKQMKRTLLYHLLGHAAATSTQTSAMPTPPMSRAQSRASSVSPQSRSTSVFPTIQRPANMTRGRSFSPIDTNSPRRNRVKSVSRGESVLSVITEAAGLSPEDLLDTSTEWSDLGIDSLLTIAILEQLRSSTGMSLPSSLFTQYPTVSALKGYFDQSKLGTINESLESSRPRASSMFARTARIVEPPPPAPVRPSLVTRLKSSMTVSSSFSDTDSGVDVGTTTPSPSSDKEGCSSSGEAASKLILSIIVRELGIAADELAPSTTFAELGMDSLLTISVIASFREETGVSLPSSFFNENPTPRHVEAALGVPVFSKSPLSSISTSGTASPISPPNFEAKPILLQGTALPRNGKGQALFLLPDGSGSALSYYHLPELTNHSSLPVYALNSPFLTNPDAYTVDLGTMASLLLRTIRALQPHGPYLLGGWSMGGILAYEAARQLVVDAGEKVELLCLIDSPCPGTLPPFPAPTLDVLDRAGLFAGINNKPVSPITRGHFLASVRALENYTVLPLPAGMGSGMKVMAIWATDSVLAGSEIDDEKKMAVLSSDEIAGEARNWLLGKRRDFGAAGWDKLTGCREVVIRCVRGNHFNIMAPPLVS